MPPPTSLLLAFVMATCAAQGHAQHAVAASGADASAPAGSIAYTVGQVAWTASESGTGSTAQGVQHAYTTLPTEVQDPAGDPGARLGPNPTTDGVVLQLDEAPQGTTTWELYDAAGKRLAAERITGTTAPIPLHGLPASTYRVVVLRDGVPAFTLPIIKH